jgi:flagellar M-ring protein FliF
MATSPDAPLSQSPLAAGANATNPGPGTWRDRIAGGLARLSSGQKIALMVAVAAIVAILVGALLYSSTPSYKVLFSNLSEKDGGAIIGSLEQMNVPYKFSEGGGAILVPADKVHEARLRLATQGLPKGGSVGFELMESQKFGISQFLEQVNYQRALEGELARTIQTIASVSMARVHLAIPKPSVFVREEQKPTASVMLQLHPGRQLEPQQIAGITHLVASSIPQLPPSNIAIVDQNGTLLSQLKSPLGEAGLDPTQLKYIRDVEASVIRRIQEIISPITGDDNVRVQAAADIDFSQQEQTAESFKPNTNPTAAAMRSQQSSEQAQASPNPLGVPGALSNQPPVPATAPITSPAVPPSTANNAANARGQVNNAGITAQITNVGQPLSARKDSTINYEVDRTITHTKNQLGRVKRLSVAVLVNHRLDKDRTGKIAPRPLSDAEIKQLNELARDAMGFSPERGDTLTVVNSSFSSAREEAEIPFWKHPDFFEFLKELAKYALIAGVVLYLTLAVLRPLLKQMFPPEAAGTRGVGGTLSTTDEAGAEETAEEEELNMAYATYERKLAKAKEISMQDPKAVANIMKEWINPNG